MSPVGGDEAQQAALHRLFDRGEGVRRHRRGDQGPRRSPASLDGAAARKLQPPLGRSWRWHSGVWRWFVSTIPCCGTWANFTKAALSTFGGASRRAALCHQGGMSANQRHPADRRTRRSRRHRTRRAPAPTSRGTHRHPGCSRRHGQRACSVHPACARRARPGSTRPGPDQ